MPPPSQQLQGRPPPRHISRLLVANRGEIAARIVSAARELGIETLTLYTGADDAHTLLNSSAQAPPSSRHPAKPPPPQHHRVPLSSPAAYLDIAQLVRIARAHAVDAVHPGYGFLSESADFSRRMWDEAGAAVVGPGWDVLARTGDKLAARTLAAAEGVPVLEATASPVNVDGARAFMEALGGRPVMLKAVDGG
jgi:pyruvate carboxylase